MTTSADTAGSRPAIKVWFAFGVFCAVAAALVLLYLFNPVEHGFFPKCVFHSLTGLDCPGCGGLRATHQLLHGNIVGAVQLNPLFVMLLPVGGFFAFRQVFYLLTRRWLPQPFQRAQWAMFLAVVIIAFGVLRNLPWRAWIGA